MKITLESTDQIVDLVVPAHLAGVEAILKARVWTGVTERGVKVEALIPRIAARADQNLKQFEEELSERPAPSAPSQCFSLRMIL